MKAVALAATLIYGLGLAPRSAAVEGADGDGDGIGGRCSLYVAKSTIPGAGLGIFTGIPLGTDDWVGYGDPGIPIVDIDFHAGGSRSKEDYHWIVDEYVWRSTEAGPEMEIEAEETSAFVAGMGALPNCHFRLKNCAETHLTYDNAGVDRSSPGAGAFTPYHNRSTYTMKALAAGSELFVDYGTAWFTSREADMGLIPLGDAYSVADRFLKRAQMMVRNADAPEAELEAAITDLFELIKDSPYKSRPLAAWPSSYSIAKRAFEVGIQQTELEQSILSLDDLDKHGKCIDGIKSGNSTVEHAGRGAFATKRFEKGGYISIAPVLHIPDRDVLTMYADKYDSYGQELGRDVDKQTGKQLLLNYCFGHRQSSLVLCPYTPGVPFINHDSKNPNAKIVWSTDLLYHIAEWLEEPVAFFDNIWNNGLAFEYVATRDIEEGDEIFIDYGKEWEEVWTEHVRRWQAPDAKNHFSPSQLENDPSIPVPTHDENDSLIGKVMDAWCHFSGGSIKLGEHEWKPRDINAEEHPVLRIIQRTEITHGDYTYDVELGPDTSYLVKGVPRKALSFYGKQYGSDIFIKGAFRHEMMIPDEIFPDAWKNIP